VGPEAPLPECHDWSTEPETAIKQVAAVKLAIILVNPGISLGSCCTSLILGLELVSLYKFVRGCPENTTVQFISSKD
jgi:hypothetical protein